MLYVFGPNVSEDFKNYFNAHAKSHGMQEFTASIGTFPAGEPYCELMHGENEETKLDISKKLFAGAKVAFINSGDDKVSEYAMQTMLAARQFKIYGASEVTLVAPFLPFARQDKVSEDRMESLAADDYPFLLKASGVDRVVTVESHSHASLSYLSKHFGEQAIHLSTDRLFAETLQKEAQRLNLDLVIGAPDGADKPHDAGQRRAKEICDALNELTGQTYPRFKIWKEHTGIHQTKVLGFEGDVTGKDCVIVDDMVDGGSTLLNAAKTLRDNGARTVRCVITHALLSKNAHEKLFNAQYKAGTPLIDFIVTTDSCPSVAEKSKSLLLNHHDAGGFITAKSTAPLIFDALKRR